jgi:mannose-6-phosphate isomerase class I
MEVIMSKNRIFFQAASISSDLSSVLNGLSNSIEDLRINHFRTKEDINSTILLKTPGRQMILTALHEDTEVYSFQSKKSITFEVIEGKLLIRAGRKTAFLEKGQSLALYEKVEYTLKALEETMFLLTVSSEIVNNQKPE